MKPIQNDGVKVNGRYKKIKKTHLSFNDLFMSELIQSLTKTKVTNEP